MLKNVIQNTQNVKISVFLIVNTEDQSPSCPTAKKRNGRKKSTQNEFDKNQRFSAKFEAN